MLSLNPSLRSARHAFASRPAPIIGSRTVRIVPQAYVEPSTSFAVLQQAALFSVVLGAEAFYTRTQLEEGAAGRPDLKVVGAGAGATLASVAMVASGLYTPGFILGLLASGAMLAYNGKRIADVKQDESDWPGPKAWPSLMALLSFFALNIFIQAIRAEI